MMTIEAADEREEEIAQRDREHMAGREESFARITIDHGPEQRRQHEKHADDAEDDRGVREEKDLDR